MLSFLWWRSVGEKIMLKGVLEKAWHSTTFMEMRHQTPGKALFMRTLKVFHS